MQRKPLNLISIDEELILLSQLSFYDPYQAKENKKILDCHQAYYRKPETLETINEELATLYQVQFDVSSDEIISDSYCYTYGKTISISSPRYRYLFYRRQQLIKQQNQLNPHLSQPPSDSVKNFWTIAKEFFFLLARPIKKVYDIGKKLADVSDDIWSPIGKAVMPAKEAAKIAPFISGPLGIVIQLSEGITGLSQARKAARQKNDPNQAFNITTSLAKTLLAGIGTGIGVAYLAGALGASIVGYPFLLFMMSMFLTKIYFVDLVKNIVLLHSINKKIKHVNVQIQAKIKNNENIIQHLLYHQECLHEKKNQLSEERLKHLKLIRVSSNKNEIANSIQQVEMIDQKLNKIDDKIFENENKIRAAQDNINHANEKREEYQQQKLKAERNVAFKAIELTAAIFSLVGTILTTTALLGAASVASFGIAPLVILAVGAAIGVTAMVFEAYDDYHGNKPTGKMRQWFKNTWHQLIGKKPEKQVTPPTPVVNHSPQRLLLAQPTLPLAQNKVTEKLKTLPIAIQTNQRKANQSKLTLLSAPHKITRDDQIDGNDSQVSTPSPKSKHSV